ncbi:hypothetical protein ACQ4PT_054790 [Festuca glaucescens]
MELLSSRRVKSFRPVREEEASRMLRAVALAASSSFPVVSNLSEMLAAYVADSSVRTIIGSSFKDRAALLTMLDHGAKLVASMSLPDLYPSSRLAMLVSLMPRRVKRHRQKASEFMDNVVRVHQESRTAAAAKDDKDQEDLLDVLLRIQRQDDRQFPMSTDNIKTIMSVSTISIDRPTSHALMHTRPYIIR